jgi:CDP-diacylglycerol--glycerol-3-phosphate 3-phosphatidyltransferase
VDLVKTVGKISYRLEDTKQEDGVYQFASPSLDPVLKSREFKEMANQELRQFLERWTCPSILLYSEQDTLLLPSIQMGNLGIRQDEQIVRVLLESLQKEQTTVSGIAWNIHVTSGYFNFTENYQKLTLESDSPLRIITASQEVSSKMTSSCLTNPSGQWILWRSWFLKIYPRCLYVD